LEEQPELDSELNPGYR